MVRNGIDCIEKYDSWFQGKRLGLITAPVGMNERFVSTLDILYEKYTLTALFAPEHGIRGEMMAGQIVDSYRDNITGLPVYSLYRKDSKRMTEEMLEQVDAVVYDIQDVGARYYTFLYTMKYAMEECARKGIPFIILDRVNPLGGMTVEGNVLSKKKFSFVGDYALTMRYGLTIGEVAEMMMVETKLDCQLQIVSCEGWNRGLLFPELGRPWVAPSPNLPRFEAALLYPGTCLFEGTNLSEGRGTTAPFEMIGAPYINGRDLAVKMNQLKLPGVLFRSTYFVPSYSKHANQLCQGIQIHITDIHQVRPVEIAIRLIYIIREIYMEDFCFLDVKKGDSLSYVDELSGDDDMTNPLYSSDMLLEKYERDSKIFAARKQRFHKYR